MANPKSCDPKAVLWPCAIPTAACVFAKLAWQPGKDAASAPSLFIARSIPAELLVLLTSASGTARKYHNIHTYTAYTASGE